MLDLSIPGEDLYFMVVVEFLKDLIELCVMMFGDWNFAEAYVKTLTRLDFSDHHPILICPFENVVRRSTRLFRFESAWHLNPSYRVMLQNCWRHEESVVCNLQKLQCTIKE
jgi:hypothetical protein